MSATEPLITVTYSSRAVVTFDDDGLDALLDRARRFNDGHDITGILLYRRGRFVQVLEGPESTVRALFQTIGADPRHTDMRTLLEERIVDRQFDGWTMGFTPVSDREARPAGFRSTFDDLEGAGDASATVRAARELSLWFRARTGTIA